MRFHIKSLLIVNILITTAAILSSDLSHTTAVYCLAIITLIIFFPIDIFGQYIRFIGKLWAIFLALFLFQLLLRRQGEVYFTFYMLKITNEGVYFACSSLLRYLVFIIGAIMFAHTSPGEMIKALRTWRLPEAVVLVVSLTILFLRQLQADTKILRQNLLKRNIIFRKMSWEKRFQTASRLLIPIIGSLFADIKYKVIAIELNGYGLYKRGTNFLYQKCMFRDYAVVFMMTILLILSYQIK